MNTKRIQKPKEDEPGLLRRNAAHDKADKRRQSRTRTALVQSEERYRLLLEKAGEAIFVTQNGYVTYFNPKLATITGYSSEELSAKPFVEIIQPDDRKMVIEHHAQWLMGTDGPSMFTFRICDSQGNTRWVETNAVGISWEGRPATLNFLTDITDRVLANTLYESSQRFFELTFDALGAHIAILDTNGTILAVNRSWRRFGEDNGLAWKHSGIGMNYLTACSGAGEESAGEARAAAEGIRQVMTGERPEFSMEYSCHSPERNRWFVMRVTRFENQGESRIVVAHAEITERRLAEEALRESEEKLRSITASANDAIIMMDAHGLVAFWNNAAERMFGYSAEEALGQELHRLIVPESYHELFRQNVLGFRTSGQGEFVGQNVELVGRRRNGVEFPVELSISAVGLKGTWNALGIVKDITERKRAEQDLQISEQKYRLLVENMNDAIYSVDRQGIITYMSSRIYDITGYPAGELIGRCLFEFICPEDRPFIEQRFEGVLNNIIGPAEYRIISKSGQLIWIQTSSKPIWLKGRIIGLQGVLTDVTERKKAEEAFQERAKRLELIGVVTQETTAILILDELLHQAVRSIAEVFQFYNVIVMLIENEELVLKATTLSDLQPLEGHVRLKIGSKGITSWVAHHGIPLIVPDVSRDPRYIASLEKMETRSELAVPILMQNRIIGVLDAQSARLNAFSQIDVFTLQTLAGQLAVAVENARLYEQASREISQRKETEKQKEMLIVELQQALAKVKTLGGLLPICSSCKRIRDDRGYWNQIEAYIRDHSEADFSHGFCPECLRKLYPEYSPKDPPQRLGRTTD